jgi:hypothetical protein
VLCGLVILVPFVDQVACLLGDLVENVVHVLSALDQRTTTLFWCVP